MLHEVIDNIADIMFDSNKYTLKDSFLRLTRYTSVTMPEGSTLEHGEQPIKNVVSDVFTWLHEHEEAQVMVASVLLVVGIWWLVRTLLSVLFNLICPLVLVMLAVICVPQLRQPLLGHNYPAVINLLRNILIGLADNLKSKN